MLKGVRCILEHENQYSIDYLTFIHNEYFINLYYRAIDYNTKKTSLSESAVSLIQI